MHLAHSTFIFLVFLVDRAPLGWLLLWLDLYWNSCLFPEISSVPLVLLSSYFLFYMYLYVPICDRLPYVYIYLWFKLWQSDIICVSLIYCLCMIPLYTPPIYLYIISAYFLYISISLYGFLFGINLSLHISCICVFCAILGLIPNFFVPLLHALTPETSWHWIIVFIHILCSLWIESWYITTFNNKTCFPPKIFIAFYNIDAPFAKYIVFLTWWPTCDLVFRYFV